MTKRKVPNVVRGGKAIPLKGKTNYYYMQGRKHSSGGIDIGENPRTGLEVEDGEVMHVADKEIKVFSSVPFLNGKSPAQKVMGGENPTKVFNQQEEFKDKHNMNDDGTKKKKRMGGLSRKKDYGSKSKPYPSVKSGDFAGGHRSYPIPTKADARDALRLAGLHGRSDVRSKVYAKYPDFRKKSKDGGLYSVTVNGKTKLKMFPSTGERTKAPLGTDIKLEEPKDVLGIYRPFNADGSVNPFYSPTMDGERRLREFRRNTNFNDDGTFNLQSYLDRQREDNDPFKLNAVSTDDTSDDTKTDDKKDNWWSRTTNKVGQYIKENPDVVSDTIGLTSNTVGGLISHGMNRRMLNRLEYTGQPIARTATKLKTRININPQLDRMRETLAAYERDVDNNTASSRVALARKQSARLANMLQTNELYSTKENTETELINKDRLNQQDVANNNIRDYNTWANDRAAFRNAVLEKQAENDVSLIETLNSGVQDLISNRQKRKNERQTITAMALANPDLPIEVFYEQGLINKNTYDAYKKAYRNKKKDKKD